MYTVFHNNIILHIILLKIDKQRIYQKQDHIVIYFY